VIRRYRRWRWWQTIGLAQLRIMAIEHWDPLNVYDSPKDAAVYDPYLERVGRMLRSGKGADALARYLGNVRTKAMQLDESETADELFADRVVAWYSLEAPS
jgi:hypothetical protein